MKRILCMVLSVLLLCACIPMVSAAREPEIIRQPQNPRFPEHSTASYSVTLDGENLSCNWYLVYEGETYNLSEAGSGQPWEGFAGATYGAYQEGNTFTYFFGGIEEGLNGAEIYAEIEDGHFLLTSDRAVIQVGSDAMPPVTEVPAAVEVRQGENYELCCGITGQEGDTFEFMWHETTSGSFYDMMAIGWNSDDPNAGETEQILKVDTSKLGTRYYICAVGSSSGGTGYTSVIPVTVVPDIPVLFTADSSPVPGGKLTVDIEAMTDYDSAIWNAFLEHDVRYTWYQDGASYVDQTGETLVLDEGHVGSEIYVEVRCFDLVLKSDVFYIGAEETVSPEILTTELPEAVAGEEYYVKLECADPNAEYVIYFNPGSENQFEETGLEFTAQGELKGVPAAPGSYTFHVSAVSESGEQSFMSYTLTVAEPAAAPGETTEPAAEPEGDPDKAPSPVPMILGIAAGAAVGAGVAVLVLRKKKK